MTEDQNEQDKPGKLQRFVGKFDFLSIAAAVIIVLALLSSLFGKTK
jgi:hypothetical protein